MHTSCPNSVSRMSLTCLMVNGWSRITRRVIATPKWVVLGMALLLLSGVLFSLDRLREYVVHQYEITSLLAESSDLSNQMNAMEWQAISLDLLTPQLRRSQQQQSTRLKQLIRQLKQEPGGGVLQEVAAGLRHFVLEEDTVFTAMWAGRMASVVAVKARHANSSFEHLGVLQGKATAYLKRHAATAERIGEVGSFVVVVLALILIVLLAHTFDRLSQQTRQAVAERHRLEELESRDSLTGLLNRAALVRRYAALPPGQALAVVMADLNDLKTTNDQGGHSAGDALLQRVANALTVNLPPDALIARWGGDEFVVLLPSHDHTRAVSSINAVNRHLGLGPLGRRRFAFGIGITLSGEPLERPLAVADAAMYEHKARIRGGETVLHGVEVSSLEEFVAKLTTFVSKHDLLTRALPMARTLLGFDVMMYVERDSGAQPRGPDNTTPYRILALDGTRLTLSETRVQGPGASDSGGVILATLTSGRTNWSNDCPTDPHTLSSLGAVQIKSCGASPVNGREETQGAVVIANVQTWRPITPQVRRVMEALGQHLADILERDLMVSELQQALEGGQRALGIALELRDHETAGHTERVVQLSADLGRRLNLRPNALHLLRQGAYLHDLGKITVPDAVLLKPGRFTPDERAIMETHVTRGDEIASQIAGLPQGTLDVIRFHHERWDGTGYPDHLEGEQIPLLARIFAICDVYDALTSERPYKRAWSPEEAMVELKAQSGRHFDPEVVRAFSTLHTEAFSGAEQFPGAVVGSLDRGAILNPGELKLS